MVAVSLPIVAVVMEEVGDFTEDFKRGCVSEWHGDGWLDDVGGVCLCRLDVRGVVCWGILCCFQWVGVVCFLFVEVWRLVSVFSWFHFLCFLCAG